MSLTVAPPPLRQAPTFLPTCSIWACRSPLPTTLPPSSRATWPPTATKWPPSRNANLGRGRRSGARRPDDLRCWQIFDDLLYGPKSTVKRITSQPPRDHFPKPAQQRKSPTPRGNVYPAASVTYLPAPLLPA